LSARERQRFAPLYLLPRRSNSQSFAMKKSKRILLALGLLVLVAIVVGGFLATVFLNDIVKKSVEIIGPRITQVPVTLNAVDIGLLTGSAKLKGLTMGNPDGYSAPSAISMSLAEVGVNPASLFSDKIVIRTIHLISPEINFEGNPLGKNNLGEIMQHVNAMSKNGGPPAADSTAKTVTKPAKKFEVDDFVITGAQVHIRVAGLGSLNGKEITQGLPDIHLTGLGRGGDGITSAELTRVVLSAITSATVKAAASSATDLGKDVDKLKKGFNGLLGK
jgi:uncharacterized protein involved in outer membrane biogenesis